MHPRADARHDIRDPQRAEQRAPQWAPGSYRSRRHRGCSLISLPVVESRTITTPWPQKDYFPVTPTTFDGSSAMREFASVAMSVWLLAAPAPAQVPPFPAGFKTQTISTNGAEIFVRVGGHGPAVVLLHGYGETGDMWAPLAARLAPDHTVIVPDLRGMGLSSRPEGGYDKKTQGHDIAGVLDALKIERADLVTHDIGNMVGYAFVAQYPSRVTKFVLIDAPVPGVGPWEEILKNPLLWHFRFGGPDMERLVAGRERIYLDRFWNEFSANPSRFSEPARVHYAALYAMPGAMHAGFAQFAAFDQDAVDNKAFIAQGK